jgi:hypothetical protein
MSFSAAAFAIALVIGLYFSISFIALLLASAMSFRPVRSRFYKSVS